MECCFDVAKHDLSADISVAFQEPLNLSSHFINHCFGWCTPTLRTKLNSFYSEIGPEQCIELLLLPIKLSYLIS